VQTSFRVFEKLPARSVHKKKVRVKKKSDIRLTKVGGQSEDIEVQAKKAGVERKLGVSRIFNLLRPPTV
jgi:hypothetical protein